MSAIIETRKLSCGYDGVAIVKELELYADCGELVALLGPNGAGKTTTLLTLSGELPPIEGTVSIDGAVSTSPLHRRARNGLGFVTEERSVFMGLSVAENLRVGRVATDDVLAYFPELEPRLSVKAGLLSGGEQQMLTLARALARKPRILLADELSLGLAPLIVKRLLAALRQAADDGLAVVLVEQHLSHALRVADRAYVLDRGQVVLAGETGALKGRLAEIEASYLGRSPARDPSSANGAERR